MRLRRLWQTFALLVAAEACGTALVIRRPPHLSAAHLGLVHRIFFAVAVAVSLTLSWGLRRAAAGRTKTALLALAWSLAAFLGGLGIYAALIGGGPADAFPLLVAAAVSLGVSRPQPAEKQGDSPEPPATSDPNEST